MHRRRALPFRLAARRQDRSELLGEVSSLSRGQDDLYGLELIGDGHGLA